MVIDRRRKKSNGNSAGPTELGLRGNQEFLTLIPKPNTAVFLGSNYINVKVKNSGPTFGIIFCV